MVVESYGDEDLVKARDDLGRSSFFKLKDGDNKIRIVRWKNAAGKKRTCAKRVEHFIPGGGAPVVCNGKGCEICTKAARLMADPDQKNADIGKRMRAQDRVYFNIVDRDNEERGVQMVAFPPGLSKSILDLLTDVDYNTDSEGKFVLGLMLDVEKGRDLKIKRYKEDNFTRYKVNPAPNPSTVDAELAAQAVDLEAHLTKGPAKKEDKPKEGEAANSTKPACFTDGETYDKDSAMCKECGDREKCSEVPF